MSWINAVLDRLAANPVCGYTLEGPPAVEPTSLAALGLLAHSRLREARPALNWLTDRQSADGSLGIDANHASPQWPTPWALLAWQSALDAAEHTDLATTHVTRWRTSAKRATHWALTARSTVNKKQDVIEHDQSLVAWCWVLGTHAWVEPTAMMLCALKATGRADHPRCREAVSLLLDRMLPNGGWNYGNTVVLGNVLRPHVQPTGLALTALSGEALAEDYVVRSLQYLDEAIGKRTTTASLCYAMLGAGTHAHRLEDADSLLRAANQRTLHRDASPYRTALVALAAASLRETGENSNWRVGERHE